MHTHTHTYTHIHITVLLSAEGLVKICDFGLSRLYDASSLMSHGRGGNGGGGGAYSSGGSVNNPHTLTMTTRVGTPAYMAPELAQV
jgi:serine/threonine protein kinase